MKASRGTTTISTERIHQALAVWEDSIGGREALANTLAFGTLDARLTELVRMLTTSRLQEHTLQRLCQDTHVTAHELLEVYRKAAYLKGQTVAVTETAKAMPALIAHLITQSMDHMGTCLACQGTGHRIQKRTAAAIAADSEPSQVACGDCQGTGEIFVAGEAAAQTKLLNILQLGPKQTTITAVKVELPPTGGFSDLMRNSDGAARAIDATLLADGEEVPDVSPESGGRAADETR